MLVLAVIVALATQNLAGVVVSTVVAAIGGFFLLRPRRSEFYVEVASDSLVIHALWSNRIELVTISSVDLHSFEYPAALMVFLNLFILLGRAFGGSTELMTAGGEPPNVIVRFNRWMFPFMALPPFIFPRRNWVLQVEDPSILQHDLQTRIDALELGTLENRTPQ